MAKRPTVKSIRYVKGGRYILAVIGDQKVFAKLDDKGRWNWPKSKAVAHKWYVQLHEQGLV